MIPNSIILEKPVITEKSIGRTKGHVYTFIVARNASKHQIQESVAAVFGVTVTDVRTLMRKGKQRRVGKTRRLVSTMPSKQAIVHLAKGQTIDIFTTPVEEGGKNA